MQDSWFYADPRVQTALQMLWVVIHHSINGKHTGNNSPLGPYSQLARAGGAGQGRVGLCCRHLNMLLRKSQSSWLFGFLFLQHYVDRQTQSCLSVKRANSVTCCMRLILLNRETLFQVNEPSLWCNKTITPEDMYMNRGVSLLSHSSQQLTDMIGFYDKKFFFPKSYLGGIYLASGDYQLVTYSLSSSPRGEML